MLSFCCFLFLCGVNYRNYREKGDTTVSELSKFLPSGRASGQLSGQDSGKLLFLLRPFFQGSWLFRFFYQSFLGAVRTIIELIIIPSALPTFLSAMEL